MARYPDGLSKAKNNKAAMRPVFLRRMAAENRLNKFIFLISFTGDAAVHRSPAVRLVLRTGAALDAARFP